MWLLVASEAHIAFTFIQRSLWRCLHAVQCYNLTFQQLVDSSYPITPHHGMHTNLRNCLDIQVSFVGVPNMVWASVRHPDVLWSQHWCTCMYLKSKSIKFSDVEQVNFWHTCISVHNFSLCHTCTMYVVIKYVCYF